MPLGRLTSFGVYPCPLCLRLGGRTLAPSVFAPYVYMQRQKKQASRQAKKQVEGKACQRQDSKRFQTGANEHVKHTKGKHMCYQTKGGCLRRTNVGLDRVSIVPLDWSMDDTQTHA